jgi:hypothetical protein
MESKLRGLQYYAEAFHVYWIDHYVTDQSRIWELLLSQGPYNNMAAWAALPEGEEQALRFLNQHHVLEHWQIGMEYDDAVRVWHFQHYGPNPDEGSWYGNIENHTEDEQQQEPEPNHAELFEEMNRQNRIGNLIWQADGELFRSGGPFRPRSTQATG